MEQLEFNFSAGPEDGAAEPDGFDAWRAEMRAEDEAEARRLGLPLRHVVEVQLESGPLLKGRLELANPELLRLMGRPPRLALRIGGSVFDHGQVARCISLEPPEE